MTAIKWFAGVKTLEELKREYRKLAKEHHPDMGGKVEDMQNINSEYDYLASKLPHESESTSSEQAQSSESGETREQSEAFRRAVLAVVVLEGVNIEICGSWIWVSGNTYQNKETIKAAGYSFSHNKKAWYWHEGEYHRGRGRYDMDEIRAKYGSEHVQTVRRAALA